MESTASRRVLVVANRTAATPDLLEAVEAISGVNSRRRSPY